MCMCVHAYMYMQVALRARRGYQIPCCEPCNVASALNPQIISPTQISLYATFVLFQPERNDKFTIHTVTIFEALLQ